MEFDNAKKAYKRLLYYEFFQQYFEILKMKMYGTTSL